MLLLLLRGHSPPASLLLRHARRRGRAPLCLLRLLPGGHSPPASLLLGGARIPGAGLLTAPALLTRLGSARLPLPIIRASRSSRAFFLAAAAEKEQRNHEDNYRDDQNRRRDDERLFVDGCGHRRSTKNTCQCVKQSHVVHLS